MPVLYKQVRFHHQSVAIRNPDVAAYWHLTKNGYLTPNQTVSGSRKTQQVDFLKLEESLLQTLQAAGQGLSPLLSALCFSNVVL